MNEFIYQVRTLTDKRRSTQDNLRRARLLYGAVGEPQGGGTRTQAGGLVVSHP